MKRLHAIALCLIICACALAQTPQQSGSIYYAYPEPTDSLTPAPEGYKPFYISHYGRHGCDGLPTTTAIPPFATPWQPSTKKANSLRSAKMRCAVSDAWPMTPWGAAATSRLWENASIAK